VDVLLQGIVGSTAYGLAGPDSDIDRLGTYAAPTETFHGLRPPVGRSATISHTAPDITHHEALKFARLCLGGNPTVTELLWLPDELYEIRVPLGQELIGIRTAFLSAPRVRDAYLGYAAAQFRRLAGRGDGSFSADTRRRTAKHARHLWRLCHQGLTLYRTATLPIRLDNPEDFHAFGDRVAAGDVELASRLVAEYEREFDETRSPLPEHPDEAPVEAWLLRVRRVHLDPSGGTAG
jgi:predicted nucleotidyltransferase